MWNFPILYHELTSENFGNKECYIPLAKCLQKYLDITKTNETVQQMSQLICCQKPTLFIQAAQKTVLGKWTSVYETFWCTLLSDFCVERRNWILHRHPELKDGDSKFASSSSTSASRPDETVLKKCLISNFF